LNSIGNNQDLRVVRGRSLPRTSGLPEVRASQGVMAELLVGGLEAREGSPRAVVGKWDRGRGSPEPAQWDAPMEGMSLLHLLVVDGDSDVRSACGEIGSRMGFVVAQAAELSSARAIARNQKVDLMLLDLKIPGAGPALGGGFRQGNGGMSLLEEVKTVHPETSVIVMTAAGTVASAVEAMRMGAEDYLTKPFALEELVTILERASRRTHLNQESRVLRDRLRSQRASGPLIGHSPEMEKLYRILSKVAHSTHPVLILGESGTGKELVARSIHFNGPAASKPFIPVDCGAVAPALIEGELFWYVKGANPARNLAGSGAAKEGLLASADGGTVFLDEIGELPLDLQAKLLRALQEKVVHPVGGTHTVPISGRLLAATNGDLAAMVEQGKFRRDLYFRLNVVSLRIPALRQRKEDIPELVQYFLERVQRDSGVMHTLSDEVLRVLVAYDWPGNVRELENAIERACAMCSAVVVQVGDLPTQLQAVNAQLVAQAPLEGAERVSLGVRGPDKIQSIAELEKQAILTTIRQLRGDKLLAAKLLGIGKTTLYRKLKEYGIQEWEGVG
jgi:DNA-binding NtrC family response regulator